MRRVAPRPLAAALASAVSQAEPATLLARVQAAWPIAAGAGLAAAARPAAEREGVVTVACESAVWVQELELLGPGILARLNERLTAADGGRVTRLRFVVGSPPNRY
jgi:predicted nucleic acid-binding Zn ribbon protein